MKGEAVSRDVARAALSLALTKDHEEESRAKAEFARDGIRSTGVDYGGEYVPSVRTVLERAVVAAKRERLIEGSHAEEGAVAGAAHDALAQLAPRAIGFNVGGKIGVARAGDHIAVALFCGIGLLHLDDVAIGLAHRAIPAKGERSS